MTSEIAVAPLRICTRKSPLALWQAAEVRAMLASRGVASELVPLSTQGDRVLDRALAEVGGKGLFVKELEEALLDGRGDLAVHSAKDVPFSLAPEFLLCAFPQRDDPRDALIAPLAKTFSALPQGARVGTSSLRRASQLLCARPDLNIISIRGNVATRLSKATGKRSDGTILEEADRLDAVVLALAGLRRLGLDDAVTEILAPSLSLPAAGQGALALEVVRNSRAHEICAALDDAQVAPCVLAERAVLRHLGGSCTMPVGAHAVLEGERLSLRAVVGGADASFAMSLIHAEAHGPRAQPERLGEEVAMLLLAKGAAKLLEQGRAAKAADAP